MRPTVVESKSGLVLLNKEPGYTSFQALYPVKRLYGRTVGHTGTLDLFAEGLLVVLVGKFTKFNPLFTAFDKVYVADFTFGKETSTLDPEGEVIFEGGDPPDSVPELANHFLGPLMQVPPEYSAIHVDGKRASDRIRSGETLKMPPRPVTVYSIDVLSWRKPVLSVRIHCSKGTYIRSIARDWGRSAGCGAYVTRLQRLKVGPFTIPETPMEFKDFRWSMDKLGIPLVNVLEDSVEPLLNGRDPETYVPELENVANQFAGLTDPTGRLLGVVEKKPSAWSYLFVDRGPEA